MRLMHWILLPALLLCGLPALARAATVDGFDFPVGPPNGSGWNHTAGWDFLEWTDEVYHPAEDWNKNSTTCNQDQYEPVYAAANGTVVASGSYGTGWGNIILIRHDLPNGETVWTQYAHLQTRLVSSGTVTKGQQIGTVGRGYNNEYCAHLHFEVRKTDRAANAWVTGWSIGQVEAAYYDPSDFINANRTLSTMQTTWLFDVDGNLEGWTLANIDNWSVSGGRLRLNPGASDPRIVSPALVLDPERGDYLRIGMWNRGSDESGVVYYSAPGQGYSESYKATFPATRSSTEHFYWTTVWLGNIANWDSRSNIDHIRIDPVKNGVPVSGSDEVQFDYIFLRRDVTNPSPPYDISVSPSGWTNSNSFTVSWKGNDPTDRPSNPVGPDVYGSGVRRFYYRVEAQSDKNIPPDSFNDRTGVASATRTVSAVNQGVNVFHVYSNDNVDRFGSENTAQLRFDSTDPTKPTTITSNDHTCGQWSTDATIQNSWSGASDVHSGVKGYSWTWSQSATTLPNTTQNGTATSATSTARPDGPNYFHVRTCDNASNWSDDAKHSCEYLIDTNSPTNPTSVTSSSHTLNGWSSNRNVTVSWSGQGDGSGSGVVGYSWAFHSSSTYVPDTVSKGAATTTTQSLADGKWYFHVRCVDGVGFWSGGATHNGEYWIDATPPTNPNQVVSSSHTPGECSSDKTIDVCWAGAGDGTGSGVLGYSIEWSQQPTTVPDETQEQTETCATSGELSDGDWYLHVKTRDAAGLWAADAAHFGPYCINSIGPGIPWIECTSHYYYVWSNDNTIDMLWHEAHDAQGVAGYSYAWTDGGAVDPDSLIETTDTTATSPELADGHWTFSLRAVDGGGNAGPTVNLGVYFIDTTPPTNAVLVPNGGEPWLYGETHRVEWEADDNLAGLDSAQVWYSTDGGITFPNYAATILAPDTTYDWPIPDVKTDSAVVRVIVFDRAGNKKTDDSDGIFVLGEPVTGVDMAAYNRNRLYRNVPNPFNPTTVIRFSLAQRAHVRLVIYDVSGRVVRTLVDETRSPGQLHSVTWDGRNDHGQGVHSGVYFCRLTTPAYTETTKMLMLK